MIEDVIRKAAREGTLGRLVVDGIEIIPEDAKTATFCLMGEPAQYAGDTAKMCPNYKPNARRIALMADAEMMEAVADDQQATRALMAAMAATNGWDQDDLALLLESALDARARLDALTEGRGDE